MFYVNNLINNKTNLLPEDIIQKYDLKYNNKLELYYAEDDDSPIFNYYGRMTVEVPEDMTDEEIEKEGALIESIFPDARFQIEIPSKKLNDIVSTKPIIIIKITYNCYCYQDEPRNTDYINVYKKPNAEGITIKDMIEKLITDDPFKIRHCDNQFLESFNKITDIEFEASFGS